MSLKIQADQVVMQELAARGVDSSVGVFGDHHVMIGKGTPIRLDEIKSAKVPSMGFGRARQIANGHEGVRQTAEAALKVLTKAGALDAGSLLGLLKAGQTHRDRLAKLGQLSNVQLQDSTWMFTQAVQNLSNSELAKVYQMFCSAEMDLLQTSLQREGEVNPRAKDARMAAERLFDMQALVLREGANRAVNANLGDMRADAPEDELLKEGALRMPKSATEAYGATVGGTAAAAHANDLAAQSLGMLIETSASSATQRERTAAEETESLRRRAFDDVTIHEIGDVMRSKELTINMDIETLVSKSNIIKHPSQPIDQVWSLKERGMNVKSEGYQVKRDQVEQMHFPEIKREQDRGRLRPVYGALNFTSDKLGAAPSLYGNAVIVLKKDVSRRATYTLNDSFYTVTLKIDANRRKDFFALFGAAPVLPDALKAAVSRPDSPERKAIERWFDAMEKDCKEGRNTSGYLCAEREIPPEVTKYFKGFDEASLRQAMTGFVIKCFGDQESTRKTTTTYDNMESLLPHMLQMNSAALAQAAKERRTVADPKLYLNNIAYIEAQIHGPIVPERDIEEIRVNLYDDANPMDDVQREQAKADLKEFSRKTGVRVVFIDATQEDFQDSASDLSEKTLEINAKHHDLDAIEKRRDAVVADFKAEVAKVVASRPPKIPEGLTMSFDGKALDKLMALFLENIKDNMEKESWDDSSQSLVDESLKEAVNALVEPKAALLNELPKIEFANASQMKAFAKWILETGDNLTVEQLKFVHTHAMAQANALRTLAAANPPPGAAEALKAMAGVAKDIVAGLKSQDAPANPFANIAFASFALLMSGEPPVADGGVARLNDAFCSADMRTYVSHLDRIAHENMFAKLPDVGAVDSLRDLLENTSANLAQFSGAEPWKSPKAFTLPLTLVDKPMRDAIETVARDVSNRLEFFSPMCPAFPKPAKQDALPKTASERRNFLVSVMEEYRQKELGKEKGRSFHGRGHIVRAYIYATAMANILAEQGVKVDFNAILCGIAGHDLARARPGKDMWEAKSGEMTVDAMKNAYGADSMGEEYENEIIDSITGVEVTFPDGSKMSVPKSETLEAHILQSADSLDIGRVKDFDPDQFAFMQFGEKNLPENISKMRDELIKEANMLQRLTNPLCETKEEYHRLLKIAGNGGPDAEQAEIDAQALLEKCEQKLIAEAEDGDNEAFVTRVEDAIRNNPQHFPILSKYYL